MRSTIMMTSVGQTYIPYHIKKTQQERRKTATESTKGKSRSISSIKSERRRLRRNIDRSFVNFVITAFNIEWSMQWQQHMYSSYITICYYTFMERVVIYMCGWWIQVLAMHISVHHSRRALHVNEEATTIIANNWMERKNKKKISHFLPFISFSIIHASMTHTDTFATQFIASEYISPICSCAYLGVCDAVCLYCWQNVYVDTTSIIIMNFVVGFFFSFSTWIIRFPLTHTNTHAVFYASHNSHRTIDIFS